MLVTRLFPIRLSSRSLVTEPTGALDTAGKIPLCFSGGVRGERGRTFADDRDGFDKTSTLLEAAGFRLAGSSRRQRPVS